MKDKRVDELQTAVRSLATEVYGPGGIKEQLAIKREPHRPSCAESLIIEDTRSPGPQRRKLADALLALWEQDRLYPHLSWYAPDGSVFQIKRVERGT